MTEALLESPEFARFIMILEALRAKLFLLSTVAILVFLVGFSVSATVIEWVEELLVPEGAKVVVLSPIELVLLQVKFGTYCALLALLPLSIFVVYRHAQEEMELELEFEITRLQGLSGILAALLLFVAGVSYALGFLLPLLLDYLYTGATDSGLEVTYSLGEFLHFAMLLTLASGLSFQLPLLVWLLVRSEVVEYHELEGYRRHVFLLFMVLAAFITPPDMISQLVLALPMSLLFEGSLLLMRTLDREDYLAAKGLYLEKREPLSKRAASALLLVGISIWAVMAAGSYRLLWFTSLEKWPLAPQPNELLDRSDLPEVVPLLILPGVILLFTGLGLAWKGRLNYELLCRLRAPSYLIIMVTSAWVTKEGSLTEPLFLLLALPMILGLETLMLLFRSVLTRPLATSN